MIIIIIIFTQDKDATPYLDKFRVDDNAINVKAMKSMGEYLYNETRFKKSSYDIAVLITKYAFIYYLFIY